MREIILHVGLHKTGTTSIQSTLYSNNKLLEDKGYLYPMGWGLNHSIPIFSVFCDNPENYHINIKKKYTKQDIKEINKNYLKIFEEDISEKKPSKIIISGEDISILTPDNLKELKKYLLKAIGDESKIRVFIYVRNPISWLASCYQERIKAGFDKHYVSDAMNKDLENLFKSRIEKFFQVFGKEYVNVYSFEDAITHEFGLVGHFLSVVGFHNSEIQKFDIRKVNESISLIAYEILCFINEKSPLIKVDKLSESRKAGDTGLIANIRGQKFGFPDDIKSEIWNKIQDEVEWLKDTYAIDYTKTAASQPNQASHIEYTEETIEDIKKAYYKLSPHLKSLLIEYLQIQVKNTDNPNLKKLLEELEQN